MSKKSVITIIVLLLAAFETLCQDFDTTLIYGPRKDTLQASVLVGRQSGNTLSKGKEIRTEVISAAGLCKMACCSLAESFENSASVSVGYSDAVTGARQIRLLGQNGVYTQMLDENRPVMRGLAAPFGLSYVPGQWLESIQIAKGVTSVINGVEAMTGQINMEHRKPTDEKPLYVQASFMNDTKADVNLVSSLQLDPMQKWSTVTFAHADANFKSHDHNGDGFMDDPRVMNFSFGNRWLYYDYLSGAQLRFGVSSVRDRRNGVQMKDAGGWKSKIENNLVNAYVKFGVPTDEAQKGSLAFVADYTYQWMDAGFGALPFSARQHSAFLNLLYQKEVSESNKFTVGASDTYDGYKSYLNSFLCLDAMNQLGAFGEYTFHHGEAFSCIAGLRADIYGLQKFAVSPRLTIKWAPIPSLVFRANGGRGLRRSRPLLDNFGVFSTTKELAGEYSNSIMENSWTYGANLTWYLPFDKKERSYLSVDWFSTNFTSQMLLEYGQDKILFRSMGKDDRSFTNNLQVDFYVEPLRGLSITITGRLTDPRQTLGVQSDNIKPMTSLCKAVLNVQYATRLNKWIFDATAALNGSCRVWDFMRNVDSLYAGGYTPAYPLVYAQITRRFKGFDVYLGGENLTGYVQPNPIIGAENPFEKGFDASLVWGPLMGVKVYAGIRMTIWKTE